MNTVAKVILYGLIIALVSILGAWAVSHSLTKSEIIHCEGLKSQSDQFPLFFISPEDKAVCMSHQIEIIAPAKNPALPD